MTNVSQIQPAAGARAVQMLSVTKTYELGGQTINALADMTIGFAAGTFTAVMGPSGSGKSTLLHCCAGLDRPDAGRVITGGIDLGELSDKELTVLRRERIGFVFQSFNLVGALTAAQNVALPLRLGRRRVSVAAIADALAAVGLADRADHRPAELSGGQQQRVALARALVTRPRVLFADEPTGALDTSATQDVLTRLRGLVDDHQQTVVTVTHDPVVASVSDRLLLLADGRVVDDMVRTAGDWDAEWIATRMAQVESGTGRGGVRQ